MHLTTCLSRSIGYTYKCLGAGIWALRQAIEEPPTTPEEGALLFERLITALTMQGGDADTYVFPRPGVRARADAGCVRIQELCCGRIASGMPPHERGSSTTLDGGALRLGLARSEVGCRCVFAGYLSARHARRPPPTYTPAGPYDPHGDADTLLDAGKGMLAEEELERRWSSLIKGLEEKVAEETRGK